MTLRWWTAGVALALAGCDTPPPGATATNDEKDKDPSEVAAVDVPGKRDDHDRERVFGRDREGRGHDHDMPPVDPFAKDGKPAEHLVATLVGLGDHKDIRGVVHLRKDESAVKVETMVEGLPAGTHAYHVHLYGDCSSVDGESAGPHLNFHGPSMDHAPAPEGTATAETTARPGVAQAPGASGVKAQPGARDETHATLIHGNLGDLVSGAGKPASADGTIAGATWSEMLVGRSVVIHEKPNDPTAGPDGSAGGRIACGVLGFAKDMDATPGGDATAEAEPAKPAPPETTPQ